MTDFTRIITEGDVSVGYISGSENVLFIKTGQGGSIYGYDNKYLELGLEINARCGLSVFVSATVIDTPDSYRRDMELLALCLGREPREIYYLGVSKGGLIGLWYGAYDERVRRILTVNAPLMVNYHGKTLPAIKAQGREGLTMVYGSLDPSYSYIPFVQRWADVRLLEGADHNLVGSQVALVDLVTEELLT